MKFKEEKELKRISILRMIDEHKEDRNFIIDELDNYPISEIRELYKKTKYASIKNILAEWGRINGVLLDKKLSDLSNELVQEVRKYEFNDMKRTFEETKINGEEHLITYLSILKLNRNKFKQWYNDNVATFENVIPNAVFLKNTALDNIDNFIKEALYYLFMEKDIIN